MRLVVGCLDEKLAAAILAGANAPIVLEAPINPKLALLVGHIAESGAKFHCRFSVADKRQIAKLLDAVKRSL